MAQDNQFIFAHSQHLASLTALRVNMTEFRYDRHAHEEYSFGVTLAGRQNFFCHGGFHSSPAGSVIQFNPGDVHDGHAGDNASLDYAMLYIPPTKSRRCLPMRRESELPGRTDCSSHWYATAG